MQANGQPNLVLVGSYETSTPLGKEIRPCPFNEHHDPISKPNQIKDVHEKPGYPRHESGEVHAVHVGHRRRFSDRSQVSFVEITERFGRFSRHRQHDRLRGVVPHLHGRGSHARNGISFFVSHKGCVEEYFIPPTMIPADSPMVKASQAVTLNLLGKNLPLRVSGPANESYLVNQRGIPMVAFGPEGKGAHAKDEYVVLGSIETAALLYYGVAQKLALPN